MKRTWILAGVATAAFLGPFSQTVYTPSIEEVQAFFGVDTFTVNLTISLFMMVLAVSQFISGPLADVRGRRATLLPGLVLFAAGSLICWQSTAISWFLAGRVIQALGISTGSVVAAAVIGDLYPPEARGQAMSTYQTVVFLGPVVGPLVGGVIASGLHWQWVFAVLTGAGVLVCLFNRTVLPETLSKDAVLTRIRWETFRRIVAHPPSFAINLLGFTQFYGYYVFLVFLPPLLTRMFHLSTLLKGVFFVPLTAGIVIGTSVGGMWQKVWSRRRILCATAFGLSGAVLAFWALLAAGAVTQPLLLAFLLAYGVLLGSSLPSQSTVLVNLFRQEKATAMGVYNFLRFIGASIGPMAGSLLHAYAGDSGLFATLGLFLLAAAFIIERRMHEPVSESGGSAVHSAS